MGWGLGLKEPTKRGLKKFSRWIFPPLILWDGFKEITETFFESISTKNSTNIKEENGKNIHRGS